MSTFGISDALCARVPALQAWLEVRGTEPGPFFVPVAKGGKVTVGA